MGSNAGMAYRQGGVDLRFAQVLAPAVNTVAWLGLTWLGSVILPPYTTYEDGTARLFQNVGT